MTSSVNKIKILQVVYSMNRGGVENWLMHVLRNIDHKRFHIDFLVHTDKPGDYDNEIKSLGSIIIRCENLSKPWLHLNEIMRAIANYGPYEVIHTHSEIFNGVAMLAGDRAGIPIRITHAHNDITKSKPSTLLKQIFCKLSVRVSRQFSSCGLACSALAARTYFGAHWRLNSKCKIFFCGLDFSSFHGKSNDEKLRNSLGIPSGSFVVGHVGSFRNENKNHKFIIDIAKEVVLKDLGVVFLLVGEGLLKPEMERKAARLEVDNNVLFAGGRSDVPLLLLSAMDMFLFPSLCEGLGLAMIEAQSAGLSSICSDIIPSEADVVPELITRMPLKNGVKEWAGAIIDVKNSPSPVTRKHALSLVEQSPFNLFNSLHDLESLYSGRPVTP